MTLRGLVVPGGGVGGVGSVTSNEVSIADAALSVRVNTQSQAVSVLSQAVSVVSQAVSVETAARVAGDNALSNAMSVVSAAAASISAFLSGLSARTSLAGASVHGLQSIINAISQRISVEAPLGGGGGSVTSVEVGAVSAQAASALSQALSVLSVADAGLSVRINTVSQGLSVVSNAASAADIHAGVASLAATSADAHAATASLAATSADAHANTVSADLAALSLAVSAISTTLSNEASVRSTADAALSDRIDAIPGGGSTNAVAFVSVDNVISATALTNVSGLTVSVSAGGIYEYRAMLMVNKGAAAQTYKFGMTFPPMKKTRGAILHTTSAVQAAAPTASAVGAHGFWAGDSASGSVIISTASVVLLSGMVEYRGVFDVSTTGVIRQQVGASAGAAALTVVRGSYARVFRLNS